MTPHGGKGQGEKTPKNWLKIGFVFAALAIHGVSGSHITNRHHAGVAKRAPASARFPTATNSLFMVPLYPTATSSAYSKPQFNDAASQASWPSDSFKPTTPKVTSVRPDRPRLIAPAYKWNALPSMIAVDPYLKYWHDTILGNATRYYDLPPVKYFMDGGSGILDNAREVKMRVKAFAYAYRMTNDAKWVTRCWQELQNAAGKGAFPFGPESDRWNSQHFLDTAEFSAAFAIGYDWLYDQWTVIQKSELRDIVIKYGLNYGLEAYQNDPRGIGWWRGEGAKGNWNCVCNGGLTMAALAILGDDTTGSASQILGFTVNNANQRCAMAASSDGTSTETANYWYFATTAHAEMASSLITATGSDYGLLTINPNFAKTGEYHMYAYGPTSLFDWGDHGPNKYSTTANAMLFYGKFYNRPEYTLFQRDRYDAADPWSMFWYDPTVSGAFWNGLAIDKVFGGWVSMRSSWTSFNALFVAMKAGKNQGRLSHNDLDVGDFVLDAMGTRWAGEFGSGDYNAPGYWSDVQSSSRWKYYRKMTEGQNTILINKANQLVTANPVYVASGSTGTKQGSSPVLAVQKTDTAFWVADITSAYGSATNVKRGVRMLNGRKQVLIQDEITSSASIQWRMHTNATITIDSPTAATLKRDGKTLKVSILSPATGATFAKSDAKRFASDPQPPVPDQSNSPVQVLIINMNAGTYNLQVLFNPQWNDGTQFVTPKSVKLANWSLASHN